MFELPELTAKDVENKTCLVRVDFNCFKNGKIKDDFRIKKTMPLIDWLIEQNCKIILMTHIEENDGNIPHLDEFFKLWRRNFFEQNFQNNLHFVNDITGDRAKEAAKDLSNRHILFLDNLRLDKREIENDENFSAELAGLADIYSVRNSLFRASSKTSLEKSVNFARQNFAQQNLGGQEVSNGVYINEAFSVSHRKHASLVGVPKFLPSFAGFNFLAEIKNLSRLFEPERPFLVFIGGKKVSTKEKVIEKFLEKADAVIIGGMMAAEFLAARGKNIGKTPIDENSVQFIKEKFLDEEKIIIPNKFIVSEDSDVRHPNLDVGHPSEIQDIKDDDVIYDVSPEFFENIKNKITESKTILWNGPMGFVEKGFGEGTKKLIYLLLQSKAEIIVGGGDTVDFLNSLQLTNKFSFVSTAGGAMLEFLANETLPGIEVLQKNLK